MATEDATTRRTVLLTTAAGLAAGLSGCTGGDGSGSPTATTTMTEDFTFRTAAFAEGASIPSKHTCDGADVSPPLSFSTLPVDADSLAVVLDDPDAPGGTFTHWTLWNVPASAGSVPGGIGTGESVPDLPAARMGENDFGNTGYRGPCPPTGDEPHTYRFTAYAVSGTLSVPAGAGRAELESALEGSTVGTSRFTGEYGRE